MPDYQDRNWMYGYNRLVEYYNSNGDTLVPQRYVCSDGYKLGSFVEVQKANFRKGILKKERKVLLDKINFQYVTKKASKLTWDDWYQEAIEYYNEHGNLDVPYNYITPSGHKLGVWINTQSNDYKNGLITDEHVIKLNKYEMKWVRNIDNWYEIYDELYEYYLKNGNVLVDTKYLTKKGVNLYGWIWYQEQKLNNGTLTKEQVDCLKEIGIVKNKIVTKNEKNWYDNYNALVEIMKKYSNHEIGFLFVNDYPKISSWLNTQRTKYKNGTLSKKKIKLLNALDIDWLPRNTAYLRNEITNYPKYEKIMLRKMRHILEDLSYEAKFEIVSPTEQERINKEIIKRMWK